MRLQKDTVLAVLQAFAIGIVLVILPSVSVEFVLDIDIVPAFVQGMPLLCATIALLACLAVGEGWF